MSKNDVTGDEIKSKVPSKEFLDNYDRIFRNRIDTIGQNGNEGLHYDALCNICGKELEKVTECAWTSCPKWLRETK